MGPVLSGEVNIYFTTPTYSIVMPFLPQPQSPERTHAEPLIHPADVALFTAIRPFDHRVEPVT